MTKKIIKDTLAFVVITLAAALCLSFVYQVTKDKIAEAEAKERTESFYAIFPEAKDFELLEEQLKNWKTADGVTINEAYRAKTDGEDGCVLSVTSHNGYGGDVTLSIGFDGSRTITGVKVTAMSETSGLGSVCTDEKWISQFAGKTSDSIGYVKNGNPADDEIDAISSATHTTEAVLEAVNESIRFAQSFLKGEAK